MTQASTDDIEVPVPFAFDENVSSVFPNMLARSVPGYFEMRETVAHVGGAFLRRHRLHLDLGCSRGDVIADVMAVNAGFHFGVDVSAPMLGYARRRFDGTDRVGIIEQDIAQPWKVASHTFGLITSVLTLMFVPTEDRAFVVHQAFDRLAPGGAFVLVEKVLGSSYRIDHLLKTRHEERKRQMGYTDEEVARKRLALKGVLNPLTESANREMLEREGFVVETIWADLNFRGWLALKPS